MAGRESRDPKLIHSIPYSPLPIITIVIPIIQLMYHKKDTHFDFFLNSGHELFGAVVLKF